MTHIELRTAEEIIDDHGLDLFMEDDFIRLARAGVQTEVDLRGEDVVDRWLSQHLATVTLTRKEIEEYALSLGEHLTHIVREGWATHMAGFDERAAGLFIAVEATIQQLDRLRDAREIAERSGEAELALTPFDFVNGLSIRTYQEIIIDHDDWMDELASQSPGIVEASPLLQFFRDDFHSLHRDAHTELRNKVVGQAAVEAAARQVSAPNPDEGVEAEVY